MIPRPLRSTRTYTPYPYTALILSLGEAHQSHLRGAVVGLPEVAEEPSGGRSVDHPAVALLAHQLPGGQRDPECSVEVDLDDRVEQVGGQVVERLVSPDAGVVHHDVDPSVGVERRLPDRLAALLGGHGALFCDGFAAGGVDLVGDLLGRGPYE